MSVTGFYTEDEPKILTARLSIVACFLLSFVTVLLRSGLGRRLVRTTNLSIMCLYNNLNKTPSPCQGRKLSAILNLNWPGYQGFQDIGGKTAGGKVQSTGQPRSTRSGFPSRGSEFSEIVGFLIIAYFICE